MDSKSAVGQVVPYHPPAMEWINVFIYILTEKAELLIHPAGIILMVFIFCCTIGKLLFSKASFERENNIIATLCHEDEMHVRIHAIMQIIMRACVCMLIHVHAMTLQTAWLQEMSQH